MLACLRKTILLKELGLRPRLYSKISFVFILNIRNVKAKEIVKIRIKLVILNNNNKRLIKINTNIESEATQGFFRKHLV